MGDLREVPGVLPLAFHVDYWNYLGWEDPLSAPFATERQVAYRDAMGMRYIYTPQFVVGGAQQFGLMDVAALHHSLDQSAAPQLTMAWSQEGLAVDPAAGAPSAGFVWLATFDDRAETEISAGENRGHTLTYHHPVLSLNRIGVWEGKPLLLRLDAPEAYGLAVLVADTSGQILGAADWRQD